MAKNIITPKIFAIGIDSHRLVFRKFSAARVFVNHKYTFGYCDILYLSHIVVYARDTSFNLSWNDKMGLRTLPSPRTPPSPRTLPQSPQLSASPRNSPSVPATLRQSPHLMRGPSGGCAVRCR